jgi:hypothetical protein
VAEVEALALRLDAERPELRDELDDLRERVLEDHVEDERLAGARVLGVVHRAHVQRGHVRAQRAQVGQAGLERDADRARGEVDDDVAGLARMASVIARKSSTA